MLISIDSIYCILLITEIKASTRFNSEKAFYSGYHQYLGEILVCAGSTAEMKSVWVPALCKVQHSIPGISDLFVRKESL